MTSRLLIYGANGYTGRLIARAAAARGLSPILAGRNREQVEALARELACESRVFALQGDLRAQLAGASVVLHCAGPYVATSAPMLDACIAARACYLDLTGELPVFEAVYARDAELRAVGVTAVPGVGFDAVPTEGLAVLLKQRMPDAFRVRIAIDADGAAATRGTVKSALEIASQGPLVRVEGALRPPRRTTEPEPFELAGKMRRLVPFAGCELAAIYRSTGIPNIEMGFAMSERRARLFASQQRLAFVLRAKPIRRLAQRLIDRVHEDPTETDLREGRMHLRGDAWGPNGHRALLLTTPQGYVHTVDAALACVDRALAGSLRTGALAPSQLLPPEAMLALPGVSLSDA
jgi:short subunit dehydrogenase-like uncharacterized protein